MEQNPGPTGENDSANRRIRLIAVAAILVVAAFLLSLGGGYLKSGQDEFTESSQQKELIALYEQVNPRDGYALPVAYGDLGPRLIESGAIDYDAFAAIYENGGNPLTEAQTEILKQGSNERVVISAENAHFLLNYFWAVGLANQNPILTEGPMVQNSGGQVERYASTGGWGLASKPVTDFYASMELIPLTSEQQKQVEEVAAGVYRPCCNNPTLFPDCNHGMAMLGLLELMASQGASTDQMFEAAKYVNAHWFPQQTLEAAIYLQTYMDVDFVHANARLVVGDTVSSAAGAAIVHQALESKGLLKQMPGQGNSCAN
jgi:hypothetical protein